MLLISKGRINYVDLGSQMFAKKINQAAVLSSSSLEMLFFHQQ